MLNEHISNMTVELLYGFWTSGGLYWCLRIMMPPTEASWGGLGSTVSAKDWLRTVCIESPNDALKMREKNKAHPHFKSFTKYKYG